MACNTKLAARFVTKLAFQNIQAGKGFRITRIRNNDEKRTYAPLIRRAATQNQANVLCYGGLARCGVWPRSRIGLGASSHRPVANRRRNHRRYFSRSGPRVDKPRCG